ncbi:MAG: transporter substrate-binding domain-containing protein [Actinobacteria bacterium]|nr:transporter substrate-binding domain-containing protein [Actinomycetota bacterium]
MRRIRLVAILCLLLIVAAACGGETTAPSDGDSGSAGQEGTDLLAVVKERGRLIASTDPAYPPQSSRNPEGEFEGFDIDVTAEISKRLGLTEDVEYITPAFGAITSGNWSGRWDLSVGSVTITPEREQVLLFTEPYYFTPASAAVHTDNTDIQDPATDLDGATIGVCQACSYELYLQGKLELLGEKVPSEISDADVKSYNTDSTAIQDLALGDGARLDAAMSALPTLEQAIANDTPIKVVGDPLFYEPLGVALDKESPEDPQAFFDEVNRIIQEMHSDGTLTELSEKWYDGTDLTKRAG